MSMTIREGVNILREDGLLPLLTRGTKYIWRNSYEHVLSLKGSYSLTISNESVTFSAPNTKVVRRNNMRFTSEKKELQAFLGDIRPDDVVYDIGANTGLYSLFAAKKCPDGAVVAFEPYPPNVQILNQDITRNGLDNIRVRELALSNTTGLIAFTQPSQDDIGYGSSSITRNQTSDTIEVPTAPGDELIIDGELPQPNVLKIDVEGAEGLVIDGLRNTLSAPKCRVLYCEVHLPGSDIRPSSSEMGVPPDELEAQLRGLGFSVEEMQTRGNERTLRATK